MNVLVKPRSDSDGNLVILMDNSRDLHLVDVTTGEVIERGRNTGSSNGRESTFRFSSPGSAYRNVGLMDDKGNIILTLSTAGDRVQFNYQDYDALVATPVSTIEGYRFDNSANIRAQTEGRPSNADIGNMTSEEYLEYLNQQQAEAQAQQEGGDDEIANTVVSTAVPIIAQKLTEGAAAGTAGGSAAGGTAGGGTAGGAGAGSSTLGTLGTAAWIAAAVWGAYNSAKNAKALHDQGIDPGEYSEEQYRDVFFPDAFGARKLDEKLPEVPFAGVGPVETIENMTPVIGKWTPDGFLTHSLLSRKTTKEYQRERAQKAFENAVGDEDRYFVEHFAKQKQNPNDTGVFQSGPLAGRGYNWDEVKRFARPEDVWGSYGFIEAFPDWISGYTEEQRRQIAQAALDENLLESDKGNILFSGKRGNLDRIREIGQQIKEGTYKPTKTEEQREMERQQAAKELGVNYQPGEGAGSREENTPKQPEKPEVAPEEARPRPPSLAFEGGDTGVRAPTQPQGRGGANGPITSGDPNAEPPISDFEQIAGGDLPPPGADNAALALSLLQSAPSRQLAGGLMNEAFSAPRRRDTRASFADLQGVF